MSKKAKEARRTPCGIENWVKLIAQTIREWIGSEPELGLRVVHKGANITVVIGHPDSLAGSAKDRVAAPPLKNEQKRQIKALFQRLVEELELHIRHLRDLGSQIACAMATG